MDEHAQLHTGPPRPETPVDAGSQALSEALRSSFGIVRFVMVLLLLVFLFSGVFIVGPNERAIVLRLGKPVGTGEQALKLPGLHLSFPYPIDEHVNVSISGIQKASSTVGWYATTPEMELAGNEPMAGGTLNPAIDGYAVTADNNIVHTRATLTYRINEPVQYVFSFVNGSNAVQNALDNALLFTATHYPVDQILTRDVIGFSEAVRKRVTDLVEQRKLGVVVEQCTVQSSPPRQVKDAFANVLKAEVARDKVVKDAHIYENQVTNRASADAASRVNLAQSDRARLVNDVKSRAKQFQELLPKYQANPNLFAQQRLTETIGRVLTNVQDKIYISEGPKEVRYQFNREMPKPKTEETKP